MLRHGVIVIIFTALLTALILWDLSHGVPWILYLALGLVFFSIEFYGAYFIHSNFHLQALCKGHTSEKVIALSFDDGPAEHTEKILDVLNDYQVKATFFCIGSRIEGKEVILNKINSQGHLIGNHSYAHNFLYDLNTTAGFVEDLQRCNHAIRKAIGKTPAFFRPPYGVTTPGLARAARALNFHVVGWNIRSLDTSIRDQQKILARIKKGLQPGSILLLHDTVPGTEFVLKELLIYLKDQQYKVVPLDTLIQKQAYV